MATDREALLLQISADVRGLEKAFNRANGIIDTESRKMERRGGLLVNRLEKQLGGVRLPKSLAREYERLGYDIGRGIQRGSQIAQIALLGISAYAIKLASDAGEIESAFDVAFKNSAAAARAFSDELGGRVGRDAVELRQSMTRLQLVITGTGVAAEQAAELVKSLTTAGVDAGSLFNTSDAEALQKIVSGLTGETEPLKAFGVVINDAALKAELLRLGFKGTTQEASEAAKTIARTNLILKGLAVAQGDAERTAGSAANQTRALRAEFNKAARELGEQLLPAFIKATKGATDLLRAFSDMPSGVQIAGLAILGFIAAGGPIAGLLANLGRVIKLAKETRAAIASIAVANAAAGGSGLAAGAAGAGGVALGRAGLATAGVATGGIGLIVGGAGAVIAGGPDMARRAARNPAAAATEDLADLQGRLQRNLAKNAENASYPLGGFGDRQETQALLDRVTAELLKRGADQATAAIAATGTESPTTVQGGFSLSPDQLKGIGGDGKGKKGPKAPRDVSDERAAQIAAQVAAANEDVLRATLDLATNVEKRGDLEKQIVQRQLEGAEAAINGQIARLEDDKGLDDTKRDELKAQLELVRLKTREVADLQTQVIDRETAIRLAEQQLDATQLTLDGQEEVVSLQLSLATTAKQRRDLELQLLDLADQRVRAEAEAVMATSAVASAEYQLAEERLRQLDASRPLRQAEVGNRNRGPLDEYLNSLPDSIEEVNESMEALAVRGLQSLEDAIVDLATGARDAEDILRDFVTQMLAEFLRLQTQRAMADFGASGAAGFLKNVFGGGGSADPLAGLYADGTDYARGGLSLVGERGPELLNIPRGAQVIPNDILRSIARRPQQSTPQTIDNRQFISMDVRTPDGDSFRRSTRQISRELKQRLG